MLPFRSGVVALLALSPCSFAQTNSQSSLRPVTGAVKDAGVYHVGLGTWTRHTHDANLGTDIIYANTCPTGYYSAQMQGEIYTDEGRVPSTTGPVNAPDENNGCNNNYIVDGFQIGYCTNTATMSVGITFQGSYAACTPATPVQSFTLTSLPGSPTATERCWLVTIDLDAASQTFNLVADATGTFPTGDSATNHLFGWSFSTLGSVSSPSRTGPLIAGHGGPPATSCAGVDGTRWDTLPGAPAPTWPANVTSGGPDFATNPAGNDEDGRGMDTQDEFRVDGPTAMSGGPGCYSFTGNPLASFHLRLFSTANCCPPGPAGCCGGPCNVECIPGVGGVIPCPCGNPQVPAGSARGCNNSAHTGGAKQRSSGTSSVTTDTLIFTTSGELPHASTILLQGKDPLLAAGVQFGQGVRCINTLLKRLYVHPAVNGAAMFPQAGDLPVHLRSAALGDTIVPGAIRHYMCYYRDPVVLGGCFANATFNATEAQVILWTP
jgi:hypothetical protein